jgi:3-methyl-2-oxobutanoate hydroxymethyltransferase
MRSTGEKIAVLTCYDASFAQRCDAAGVDALLIGDSLGMVLQGHDSTLPVTLADIAYHTASVARGCKRPLIIADMPFGSFQESPQHAFRNAVALMAAGAQMVKLEGGAEMADTTKFLTARGIPVCAHVGLTPQSVHQLGGYRVQGKDDSGAARLISDALAQQEAGASLIVLEAIPEALASEATQQLRIPTIGIGASRECAGQVLVLHDMLDIPVGKKARFVKNFMAGQASIAAAITAYVAAVKDGSFPAPEHCYQVEKNRI